MIGPNIRNKFKLNELNFRTVKQKFRCLKKMFKTNAKVTNNSKEAVPSNPNLLIKEGYITKLKSKKRRYFVLYTENENEPAHLDYYESEKKFRASPNSYKRSILLKDCFAVIKKNDPRFKKNNIFVFAIYTRDDCFSLMFDNQDEMNSWFSLINEVHLKALAKNKRVIHDYDKIWYAVIKNKKSKIRGYFYLCLTSEEIHLYKIKDLKDKRSKSTSDKTSIKDDQQPESIPSSLPNTTGSLTAFNNKNEDSSLKIYRYPFSLIRSFGHQLDALFIQLGRSSDLGSCQLWFELKDCDTSQYIHSLVANTRTAAKNNEFRTRSNSENNRMLSRRNKSMSEKQQKQQTNSNNITTCNSKLSSSSKISNNSNHKLVSSCDSNKLIKKEKEKESSTEYVPSIAYTAVAYTLGNNQPIRSRSTSESSTCYKTRHLLNSQSSNQITSWSNNNIVSTYSMNSNNEEEKDSDYYMTTPNQGNDAQPPLPSPCTIKEEDYLLVDELPTSLNDRTFSNASTIQVSKLESIKSSDLKLVPTTSSLAKLTAASSSTINHTNTTHNSFILENAQHYKQVHSQYSSPINNSFVELPDQVEELNDDLVDEYIQVELGAKKLSSNNNYKKQDSRLETISSEPSSNSDNKKSTDQQTTKNIEEEDDDYIGIESFSSTNTATNQETENFEISNLSSISPTSCNVNRIKTFSISSNNTSNNELNSLGTSPSLLSNPTAFYSQTPVNHIKEEVFKLDKVKSYFNSTEDCDDYIKPARTYSMGSRPQLANHKLNKHPHCQAISKSNTMSNTNSLIINDISNKYLTKKVQCGHLITNNEPHICNHSQQLVDENFVFKDNRVRAYSMGSHSTIKKDLLRKIRLNQLSQQNKSRQDSRQSSITIEDEESEKCLSTPILAEDKDYSKNRSATFADSSTASTSSKKTANEQSSSEDDLMDIDLSISKSAPRFENEFNYNSYSHNQISIKEKFKELSLDSDELKSTDEAKEN